MYIHQPVLLKEVLDYLQCTDGKVYVDGTIGEGGHAEQILERSSPGGRLIGIDLDQHILRRCAERLERFGERVRLIRDNFKNIRKILSELKIEQIDGLLLDLGISSFHLENAERGFSFQKDAPLDMRLDQDNPLTAATIVNRADEAELAKIFWQWGEERWSRRIAKAIVNYRQKNFISTTGQLADIVRSAIPARFGAVKIDPATRVFQALRIAVNRELEDLDRAIEDAVDFLSQGARICIISFHSLEDRIVKRSFRQLAQGTSSGKEPPSSAGRVSEAAAHHPRLRILTPKPIVPTQEEILANIRARSAKLRVAEKC
ncbi:MAG: 16S rRNA (cytosine(1402)-N(4))-methyltransferase RsmH [bacterium]|nr:16S rRNA (cytosine(1402)-N(4))-methyltransferase RsmH [bacterium]